MENELSTSMPRTSLPNQQSIPNFIYFFHDSVGLFKTRLCWSPKHINKHYIVESFNRDDYLKTSSNTNGAYKLSEDILAKEACYHEHWIAKFRNKLRKFFSDQENLESLEGIVVAESTPFVEDSLKRSDQFEPFIELSVIQKCSCCCPKNLKAPIVSLNAARLK